jgi:hypothetical protein
LPRALQCPVRALAVATALRFAAPTAQQVAVKAE